MRGECIMFAFQVHKKQTEVQIYLQNEPITDLFWSSNDVT